MLPVNTSHWPSPRVIGRSLYQACPKSQRTGFVEDKVSVTEHNNEINAPEDIINYIIKPNTMIVTGIRF